MAPFEEFEQQLYGALTHLYDPVYRPPHELCVVLDIPANLGPDELRKSVVEAISKLKPAADVPPNAHVHRLYELLEFRYIRELTQEETADRLGITPRHLRREQHQAVSMLAQRLWENKRMSLPEAAALPSSSSISSAGPPADEKATQELAWRLQVRQELAVLQQSEPGAVTDVAAVLEQVAKLEQELATRHGTRLISRTASEQDELLVRAHPSVLRQILIVAIQKLVEQIVAGEGTVSATGNGEKVQITLAGAPLVGRETPESEFIRETMTAHGGEVETWREGKTALFQVVLPRVKRQTVMVVDDNADLVHFYRRYTERTSYQIVHIAEGQQVGAAVQSVKPDVIVLDVMLPDVDGWEVLSALHGNPATRSTPVIVCSVVRQEELALALGAVLYVPKPVRRQEFIRALDQVLAQASEVNRQVAENR